MLNDILPSTVGKVAREKQQDKFIKDKRILLLSRSGLFFWGAVNNIKVVLCKIYQTMKSRNIKYIKLFVK